jgi:hypothetical protein
MRAIATLSAAALSLAWLAACAAEPAPPVAVARFRPPNLIEVEARSAAPLVGAELIDDKGAAFPATLIEQGEAAVGRWRPGIGIEAHGGPQSGVDTGVSIGLPLTNPFRRPAPLRPSSARFEVIEEAYRANWQAWRIRLTFGDTRGLALDAPAPE